MRNITISFFNSENVGDRKKFCEFRTELLFILRNISYTPGSFGSVVFCSVFLWRLLNRFCFAMIMRFSAISFCLAFPFLLPLSETLAQGRIIYVDRSLHDPHASRAEDGSTWEKAYDTLEEALEEAEDGNQIWVARGEYDTNTPSEFNSVDYSPHLACFTLGERVRLFGGFPNKDDVSDDPRLTRDELSDRRPLTYRTVVKRGGSSLYTLLRIGKGVSFDGFLFRGETSQRVRPIYSKAEDKFTFTPLINVTTSETVTFSRCLFSFDTSVPLVDNAEQDHPRMPKIGGRVAVPDFDIFYEQRSRRRRKRFSMDYMFKAGDSDYALIGTYSLGTPVADYPKNGLNLVISQCIFSRNFMGLSPVNIARYKYSDNFSESDVIHRGVLASAFTSFYLTSPEAAFAHGELETFSSYVAPILGENPRGLSSWYPARQIMYDKIYEGRPHTYGEYNSLRDYDDWLRRVALIKMGPPKAPKGKESQGSLKLVNSAFYHNGNLKSRRPERNPILSPLTNIYLHRPPFYLLCLPKVGTYELNGEGLVVNDERKAGNIEVVIANNVFYDNTIYSEIIGESKAFIGNLFISGSHTHDLDRFMFGGTEGSFTFENNYYDVSLGLGTLPDQPHKNGNWRRNNAFSNATATEFEDLFENANTNAVVDDTFLRPSTVHLSPFLDAGNTKLFKDWIETAPRPVWFIDDTAPIPDINLSVSDVPHGDAVDIGPHELEVDAAIKVFGIEPPVITASDVTADRARLKVKGYFPSAYDYKLLFGGDGHTNVRDEVEVTIPPLAQDTEELVVTLPSNTKGGPVTLTATKNDGTTVVGEEIGQLSIIGGTTVVYVDAEAAGKGDGTSWDDAYAQYDFQKAIDNAPAGAEIWMATGDYYYSTDGTVSGVDADGYFHIKGKELKIYGGFPNPGDRAEIEGEGETVTKAHRDPLNNRTVLSGQIDGSNEVAGRPKKSGLAIDSGLDRNDNSLRLLVIEDVGRNTLIDGITMVLSREAPLLVSDASPVFRRCDIVSNWEEVEVSGTSHPVFIYSRILVSIRYYFHSRLVLQVPSPTASVSFVHCLLYCGSHLGEPFAMQSNRDYRDPSVKGRTQHIDLLNTILKAPRLVMSNQLVGGLESKSLVRVGHTFLDADISGVYEKFREVVETGDVFVNEGEALGYLGYVKNASGNLVLDVTGEDLLRLSGNSGGVVDRGLDKSALVDYLLKTDKALPNDDRKYGGREGTEAEKRTYYGGMLDKDFLGNDDVPYPVDPDDLGLTDGKRDIGVEEFDFIEERTGDSGGTVKVKVRVVPYAVVKGVHPCKDDNDDNVCDDALSTVTAGPVRITHDVDKVLITGEKLGTSAGEHKVEFYSRGSWYKGDILKRSDTKMVVWVPNGVAYGRIRVGIKREDKSDPDEDAADSNYNFTESSQIVSVARRYYVDAGDETKTVADDYPSDPMERRVKGRSWAKAFKSLQTALFIAGPGSEIRVAEGVYLPSEYPREYLPKEFFDFSQGNIFSYIPRFVEGTYTVGTETKKIPDGKSSSYKVGKPPPRGSEKITRTVVKTEITRKDDNAYGFIKTTVITQTKETTLVKGRPSTKLLSTNVESTDFSNRREVLLFSPPDSVKVIGGFRSAATPDSVSAADNRDGDGDDSNIFPLTYRTILSGDLDETGKTTDASPTRKDVLESHLADNDGDDDDDDDRSGNSYGVVELKGRGPWTLKGLTIASGHRADGSSGGGLLIEPTGTSSVTTVSHCLFTDNEAPSGSGGAVYAHALQGSHTVNLFYSIFYKNKVRNSGMAVSADFVDLNIINCTFHANEASSSGSGVVIYDMNSSSSGDISNNVFYENKHVVSGDTETYKGNDVRLGGGYKKLLLRNNMIHGSYQVKYDDHTGTRRSSMPCVGFESTTITDNNYMVPSLSVTESGVTSSGGSAFDGGENGALTRTGESVGLEKGESFTLDRDIRAGDVPFEPEPALPHYSGGDVDIGAIESTSPPGEKLLKILDLEPDPAISGHHKSILLEAGNYDDKAPRNNKLSFLRGDGTLTTPTVGELVTFGGREKRLKFAMGVSARSGPVVLKKGTEQNCNARLDIRTISAGTFAGRHSLRVEQVGGDTRTLSVAIVRQEVDILGEYPGDVDKYKVYFKGPGGVGEDGVGVENLRGERARIRISPSKDRISVEVPEGAVSGEVKVHYGTTSTACNTVRDCDTARVEVDVSGSLTLLENPRLELVSAREGIPASRWGDYGGGDAVLFSENEFYFYGYNLREEFIEAVYLDDDGVLEESTSGETVLEQGSTVRVTPKFRPGFSRWDPDHGRFEVYFSGTLEGQLDEAFTAWVVLKLPSGKVVKSKVAMEFLPPLSIEGELPRGYLGGRLRVSMRGFSTRDKTLNRVLFFGGRTAPVVSVGSTEVELSVPRDAKEGFVEFSLRRGDALLGGRIVKKFFSPVVLRVDGFSPDDVAHGSTLTITGSGFSEEAINTVVFLGDESDNSDDVSVTGRVATENGTRMELTVPEGTLSGPVKVRVQGSEVTSTGSLIVRSQLLLSESELFGYLGGELEVMGQGFDASSAVLNRVFLSMDGTDDVSLVVSDYSVTRLLVVLPASGLGDGIIKVSVGSSTVSVPFTLRVPQITGLTSEDEETGGDCASSDVLCLSEGDELVIEGEDFDTNDNNEVVFLGSSDSDDDDKTFTGLPSTDGSTLRVEVVPAGTKDGAVEVRVHAAKARAGRILRILRKNPVEGARIDSIQPPEGIIGDEISIMGKFSPTLNGVEFTRGGSSGSYVQASSIRTVSEREIRATVPRGAVSGTLRVTPRSTEPLISEVYNLLSPLSVRLFPDGYLGEPLQVWGSGFTSTDLSWNEVLFSTEGGTEPTAAGKVKSTTGQGSSIETLEVEVPKDAVSGPVRVTVHGSQVSSSFTLKEPAIARFSPVSSFVGEEIEILGSGFSQEARNSVLFMGRLDDDVEVSGLTAEDYTEEDREEDERQVLRLSVPEDAKTGRLAVRIWSSVVETEEELNVLGVDGITRVEIREFSPTRVRIGDRLIIKGRFSGGTSNRVEFSDGSSGTVSVAASHALGKRGREIEVRVPEQARTGPLRVSADGLDPDTSNKDLVVVLDPVIQSFSPNEGRPFSTTVRVQGLHFGSEKGRVLAEFGDGYGTAWYPATILLLSDDALDIRVPEGLPVGRVRFRVSIKTVLGTVTKQFDQLFRVLEAPRPCPDGCPDPIMSSGQDYGGVCLRSYPNPSAEGGTVYLTMGSDCVVEKVVLYDVAGRRIWQVSSPDRSARRWRVDRLPAGAYYLHAELANGQTERQRLFVK